MCALVAGVQTCALPIFSPRPADADGRDRTVSPMNARFPRQMRVRARAEFDRAFQQGRRTASPLFSLHFVAGPPPARLGLAVSRNVDPHAVGRHRKNGSASGRESVWNDEEISGGAS